MNQLMRKTYDNLSVSEKDALLQRIAKHYGITIKEQITFSRWGKETYSAVFLHLGSEFVFVPGDNIVLGWDECIDNINEYTIQGINDMFDELGEEMSINDYLYNHIMTLRRAKINPMLVERHYFSIDSIFNQDDKDMNEKDILKSLDVHGFVLPTLNEWEYLCGFGCKTLFPWGNDFNEDIHLRYFSSQDSKEPYTLEQPNFFGLFIGYDPYEPELVRHDLDNILLIKGGDGGINVCGGLGRIAGYLPCSPYYISNITPDENFINECNIRRVLHIDLSKPVITMDDETIPLKEKILYLHDTCQHKKIVDTILSLTKEERNDYYVLGRLACAYNNLSEYQKAIDVMLSIQEEGKDDSIWHYRMGYSHYFKNNDLIAEKYFKQAAKLDPNDADCWWFLSNIYYYSVNDKESLSKSLKMLKICSPEMFDDFISQIVSSANSIYDIDVDEINKSLKTLDINNSYMFDNLVNQITKPNNTNNSYKERVFCNDSLFPTDYIFCKEMIEDSYYPKELVKSIQNMFNELVNWLRSSQLTYGQIQERMDKITLDINDLALEFYERDSEIETVARESIAQTVIDIFDWYDIDIHVEHAIRNRDW